MRLLESRLKIDKKGISTSISTVILTASTIVLIIITSLFASSFLDANIARNEFATMEQFMQNIALQIDDVAWTIGRTQTIRYASRYGQLNFENSMINYTVYSFKGGNWVRLATYSVGAIMFNMPHKAYTIGSSHYERLYPSSSAFLQEGVSASVSYVYVIEKIPMLDGNFIRIVAVPTARLINSTITSDGEDHYYFKFYLPILSQGFSPRYSQSITLSGKSVRIDMDGGSAIKITATFPRVIEQYDNSFFRFQNLEETVNVPEGSIFEFFTSEVEVSLGIYA